MHGEGFSDRKGITLVFRYESVVNQRGYFLLFLSPEVRHGFVRWKEFFLSLERMEICIWIVQRRRKDERAKGKLACLLKLVT